MVTKRAPPSSISPRNAASSAVRPTKVVGGLGKRGGDDADMADYDCELKKMRERETPRANRLYSWSWADEESRFI
jgi:hypothetical protein